MFATDAVVYTVLFLFYPSPFFRVVSWPTRRKRLQSSCWSEPRSSAFSTSAKSSARDRSSVTTSNKICKWIENITNKVLSLYTSQNANCILWTRTIDIVLLRVRKNGGVAASLCLHLWTLREIYPFFNLLEIMVELLNFRFIFSYINVKWVFDISLKW